MSDPAGGEHTVWYHPNLPDERVTIAGHDGADAQDYQERRVRAILGKPREARGSQP